jgi:polyisoprenoid-binding protein YceI
MQKPDGSGNQELWGELTMKGITKNVKLNVEFGGFVKDPWGNDKAGFTITGKIKRSDWELTWNSAIEAGGVMVGDEISISCEVELINVGNKELVLKLEATEDSKAVF